MKEDSSCPRRVVLSSAEPIKLIVEAARTKNQAAFVDSLSKQLRSNVRLVRKEELKEDPVDEVLKSRLAALQKQAAELASRVRQARLSHVPRLSAEASAACLASTEQAIASSKAFNATDKSQIISIPPGPRRLGRIEKIRHDAQTTRRRVQNVLDALRIIAESESDSTITMTSEGELVSLRNAPNVEIDGDGSPDGRMVVPAINSVPLYSATFSPHVTPRTRTRRRLLASSPSTKLAIPR